MIDDLDLIALGVAGIPNELINVFLVRRICSPSVGAHPAHLLAERREELANGIVECSGGLGDVSMPVFDVRRAERFMAILVSGDEAHPTAGCIPWHGMTGCEDQILSDQDTDTCPNGAREVAILSDKDLADGAVGVLFRVCIDVSVEELFDGIFHIWTELCSQLFEAILDSELGDMSLDRRTLGDLDALGGGRLGVVCRLGTLGWRTDTALRSRKLGLGKFGRRNWFLYGDGRHCMTKAERKSPHI